MLYAGKTKNKQSKKKKTKNHTHPPVSLGSLLFFLIYLLGLCYCAQAFSSYGTRDSHWGGFSCCGARALEHRFSSCGTHMGLVVPRHVGSAWIRGQSCALHCKADSQPLDHRGSPTFLKVHIFCTEHACNKNILQKSSNIHRALESMNNKERESYVAVLTHKK